MRARSMSGTSIAANIDQSEMRFLIEKNADGIIVVDEFGTVMFVNPAAERIFGRSSDALINSPLGLPFIAGDMTGIDIHQPGGNLVEAEIRTVETTWGDRSARLISIRDVSARRALEDKLRQAAKMEAVGRLTAGIAHDFNNLLTVVLGNLENAKRHSHLGDDRLKSWLENATRGAQQAAVLTSKLLAFARRKPLEPRSIDLRDLVSTAANLLQRTLGEAIRVRTIVAADLWPVEVDPTELESAILNLAVNARDAMPGGGELTIRTENVEFSSNSASSDADLKAGSYVAISVADTGVGMPPEVTSKVFEPFFTTKPDGRGTGLGLSQVYGFAKQSGGDVEVSSRINVGTTVRMFLPRAAATSKPALATLEVPGQAKRPPTAKAGELILVVEDDHAVRDYTVGCLRELGYKVLEAAEADAALRYLRSEPDIALLFTDLGLPGPIDGKALGHQAKLLRPGIRVLVTTAYAGQILVGEGRLGSDVQLLNKPFSFSTLALRIRELLDARVERERAIGRILVVEDEFLLHAFLTDTLAEHGFVVEIAGDFKNAVAKLRSAGGRLTAAVVDMGLPDTPGDKLIGEIRSRYPDLPIVLASGYSDEDMRNRFGSLDRVRIVSKPFSAEQLISALQGAGVATGTWRE